MTDRGFDLRRHGLHLTAAHPDDAADLWPSPTPSSGAA